VCALEAAAPAPASTADAIDAYFGARALDVDAGRADVREGIAFLDRLGLSEAGIARSAELLARVARSDLASAFSAWAHRMALEYVALAPASSPLRDLLPDLRAGRVLGATALATGTARHLAGTPLPVSFRADGDGVRLDGRVPWASNLIPPFLAVTAAAHADDERRTVVVALTDAVPGVTVAPQPALLALGATGSSSIALAGARVPAGFVVADDLGPFVDQILPPFLLLQTAFCVGLGTAAIESAGAAAAGGPAQAVLGPRIARVASGLAGVERRLGDLARCADRAGAASVGRVDLLRLRLRAADLAGDAVRVEVASAGGRGYMRDSATARRVREAAFLPIQSPTEVQLRWILSHSA
jgi:alkylation response protein AidB-like acyl-CoA dehydrogenase